MTFLPSDDVNPAPWIVCRGGGNVPKSDVTCQRCGKVLLLALPTRREWTAAVKAFVEEHSICLKAGA